MLKVLFSNSTSEGDGAEGRDEPRHRLLRPGDVAEEEDDDLRGVLVQPGGHLSQKGLQQTWTGGRGELY